MILHEIEKEKEEIMAFINEQVAMYLDRINSSLIPQDLLEMKKYANANNVPVLYDESLVFLRFLVNIKKPVQILEIGTAIGYSGSAMLMASENSHLHTIEIDEVTHDLARENFKKMGVQERVHQYLGDAAGIIANLECKFDLVFVDAAKGQYLEYFKLCETHLAQDALLVFDNVLYKGVVAGLPHSRRNHTIARRMNELFEYIKNTKKYEMSLLGVGDGILLLSPKA